ncbi:MAG: hypothetical protein LBC49_03870, partial [Bacteroidales bacterium]|nr:hypothetical protein [Bacteroidales bacterium]
MKHILLGKSVEEIRELLADLSASTVNSVADSGVNEGENTNRANTKLPSYLAKQIAEWIYRKHAVSFDEMTNISAANRLLLNEHFSIGITAPSVTRISKDGTLKYLFGDVETVLIPDGERLTLCVSSQAGCKMNCVFCATGKMGFGRNLSAAEILNQYAFLASAAGTASMAGMAGGTDDAEISGGTAGGMAADSTTAGKTHYNEADKAAADKTDNAVAGGSTMGSNATDGKHAITNIVFMGMGEPLDNLSEVIAALRALTSDWGFALSPRRITVSTIGIIPELHRLIEETECHIAISLHNPYHEGRLKLMPIEKVYPIEEIIELLTHYDWAHQRKLSFEYVMLGGLNDSPLHAKTLARLIRDLPCHINLIPYHPHS